MVTMKCVVETCRSPQAAGMKGLCLKCYSSAKRQVDAGATTWEQLEEMGLAIPGETEFMKAFKKKQGQKPT